MIDDDTILNAIDVKKYSETKLYKKVYITNKGCIIPCNEWQFGHPDYDPNFHNKVNFSQIKQYCNSKIRTSGCPYNSYNNAQIMKTDNYSFAGGNLYEKFGFACEDSINDSINEKEIAHKNSVKDGYCYHCISRFSGVPLNKYIVDILKLLLQLESDVQSCNGLKISSNTVHCNEILNIINYYNSNPQYNETYKQHTIFENNKLIFDETKNKLCKLETERSDFSEIKEQFNIEKINFSEYCKNERTQIENERDILKQRRMIFLKRDQELKEKETKYRDVINCEFILNKLKDLTDCLRDATTDHNINKQICDIEEMLYTKQIVAIAEKL